MIVAIEKNGGDRVIVLAPDLLAKPMMREDGVWRKASFSVETLVKDYDRVIGAEAEALFQEAVKAFWRERERIMGDKKAKDAAFASEKKHLMIYKKIFYYSRERMVEWQDELTMIISNAAFLRAEADSFDTDYAPATISDLSKDEINIPKIRVRTIADMLEMAYKKVRDLEIELLYAARFARIERKPTSLSKLLDPLNKMKSAFKDALFFMHSETKTFELLKDYGIVSLLLTSCGTEIHKAHIKFLEKVKLLEKDIDDHFLQVVKERA